MHANELIGLLVVLGCVAAVYTAEAVLIAAYVGRRLHGRPARGILLARWAIVLHIVAAVGLACFLYAWLIEPYWLDVTHVELPTPKLSQAVFRVVHISDLHCERRPRCEQKLVTIINNLEPDLIFFTGDAVNDPRASDLFRRTMSGLRASLGKFAVCGNHDMHYADRLDLFAGTGFVLQDANTATITKNGESITVIGVSPHRTHDAAPLLAEAPDDRFTVFLMHFSSLVEKLAGPGLDLYLAGHTHGGQVRLPFYGAIVTMERFGKRYEAGLYRVGPTSLHVSRGIGMLGRPAPPVRFLARPQIAVFDIRPQSD